MNGAPPCKQRYKATGDLIIHKVTKTIMLDVSYNGKAHSPFADLRIGFHVETMFFYPLIPKARLGTLTTIIPHSIIQDNHSQPMFEASAAMSLSDS